MRILFLHVPHQRGRVWSINLMPMGLFSLADVLARDGHYVEIAHDLVERLRNPRYVPQALLEEGDFDVLCLSIHWHYQLNGALEVLRAVKQAIPRLCCIVGGYTASAFAEELLAEYPEIDYLVAGEAEAPLQALMRCLESPPGPKWQRGIANLLWRDDGTIVRNPLSWVASRDELNEFSFSNLSLLRSYEHYIRLPETAFDPDDDFGITEDPRFVVAVGRGCPVQCFYCGGGREAQKQLTGRREYVFRDSDVVVREICQLTTFGVEHVVFDYDPKRGSAWYQDLFLKLQPYATRLSCTWAAWGLPSTAMLNALAHTGFRRVELIISPDFGSEALRRRHKGHYFTNASLLETMAAIDTLNRGASNGIQVIMYFFLGGPGETEESLRKTAALIDELRTFDCVSAVLAQPPQVEPLSPLARDGEYADLRVERCTLSTYLKLSRSITNEGPHIDSETLMGFRSEFVSPASLTRWQERLASPTPSTPEAPSLEAVKLDNLGTRIIRSDDFSLGAHVRFVAGAIERIPCIRHEITGQEYLLSSLGASLFRLCTDDATVMDTYRVFEEEFVPIEPEALLPAFFALLNSLLTIGAVRLGEDVNV